MKQSAVVSCVVSILWVAQIPTHADLFGTGDSQIQIDFVTIGNPGNSDDAWRSATDDWSPYGGVSYTYRLGLYEISQNQIAKATASGLAHVTSGPWTGAQPAAYISWYQAAAFVNWLNAVTGHQPAYDLTWNGTAWSMNLWSSAQAWQMGGENLYRHRDAFYFLPSEDEWYKAGYHKNDGVTGNYWNFATGSDAPPDGIDSSSDTEFEAVFYQGWNQGHPNDVTQVGVASPYGTYGQNGNVWEWLESGRDAPNDSTDELRVLRGGSWLNMHDFLSCDRRASYAPTTTDLYSAGVRIASIIPEPCTFSLAGLGAAALLLLRRPKQS